MARSPEDLFELKISTTAMLSLDWERIEQDPVFRTIVTTLGYEATGPEGEAIIRREALREYLQHYLARERFLRDMPSTNGPGTLWVDNILGIEKL